MEAKAGWETTSGLFYYPGVAEPVHKIISAVCGHALDTAEGEMTETLT